VDADLDTLATALYVSTDDLLKARPELAPSRPVVGIAPTLSDAELVTLAVMQALLGFTSEARWLRHAKDHLSQQFPYVPGQSGYNKRLRAAVFMIKAVIRHLAAATDTFTDDVWVVDSTPVECAGRRNRETVGPGRLGRVRVLRLPLPVLLGTAPAPRDRPRQGADREVQGTQVSRLRARSAQDIDRQAPQTTAAQRRVGRDRCQCPGVSARPARFETASLIAPEGYGS
jgi:hypothetical protein